MTDERCCNPGECVYRPGLVAGYMRTIREDRGRGVDPTATRVLSKTASAELGRSGGVSTSLDIRFISRLWDVERAMGQGKVTVSEVCESLCPWAINDEPLDDMSHQDS